MLNNFQQKLYHIEGMHCASLIHFVHSLPIGLPPSGVARFARSCHPDGETIVSPTPFSAQCILIFYNILQFYVK